MKDLIFPIWMSSLWCCKIRHRYSVIGKKHSSLNLDWSAQLNTNKRYSLPQQPLTKSIEIDIRDESRIPEEHHFLFFCTLSNDNYFHVIYCLCELLSSDGKHFTISGIEYFSVRFFEKQNVQRFWIQVTSLLKHLKRIMRNIMNWIKDGIK